MFFETFPECSKRRFEKYNKKIGHHARNRNMMGQSYPIYDRSGRGLDSKEQRNI